MSRLPDAFSECVSGAEAIAMAMERCKASIRAEAEACAWLTEQVRLERLRPLWTERNPEHPYGQKLFLDREALIYIPDFPGAQAKDEIDWAAGVLRRRVRWPRLVDRGGNHIDPSKLTEYERERAAGDVIWSLHHVPPAQNGSPLAAMGVADRESRMAASHYRIASWVTDDLVYRFTMKRAPLLALLDTVSRDVPEADRAEGEPGECGCWRESAEEQEAAQTAPDIVATFRLKLRGLPRLVEERRRSFKGGSLVFVNPDHEAAIKAELRAPLKEPFDRQLRAGKWVCYGFSEERGERVRIGSPWRDGLGFDDMGGMADKRGGRYSDVLFYRATAAAERPRQPIAAQPETMPTSPVLSQSEKAKLRGRLRDFLQRGTRTDPPQARTKAEWLDAARQRFGADAVTDNLFKEVWRDADLPAVWRAPGRRT